MRFLSLGIAIFLSACTARADGSGPYRIKAESKSVAGSNVREVTSEAHYAYPPEVVWKLLNHFIAFPKFIPRLKECDSLGKVDNTERIYFMFNLPFPLPNLWNIISLERSEKDFRFAWNMLRGNMEMNKGSFDLDAEPGGSAAKIQVQADPGHLLPKWLVTWGTKNFLPKILKAIGDRLEEEKRGVAK